LYRHGKRWNPEFRIALLQSAGQGRFRVFLVVNAEECKAVPENEEIGARYLASDRADLREIPLEVKTLTENIDGCFQVLEGRYDKGGPKIYRVKGLTKKVKEECRLDLETKLEICRAVYKNAKLSDYGPSDYTRLVIKRGESVVYDTLRVDSNISGSFLKVEVFKTGDYFVILTHADYWGDFINVTIMDKRGNLWERGWEWPSGC
jgi:hypothetical protein